MKTKDEMINVVKQWYSYLADLSQKYQVVGFMRKCRRNQSKEIAEFLNSHGIRSHFSESYEQWQNNSAEITISFVMMLASTIMAESFAACLFWFRAATTGEDARNLLSRPASAHLCMQYYMESHETSADFKHSDAGPSHILMRNVVTRASIHHWLGKQYTSD